MNAIIIDENFTEQDELYSIIKKNKTIKSCEIFKSFDNISDFKNIGIIFFYINIKNFDLTINSINSIRNKCFGAYFVAIYKEDNEQKIDLFSKECNLLIEKLRLNKIDNFLFPPILPDILNTIIEKEDRKKIKKNNDSKIISFFSNKEQSGKELGIFNLGLELSKNKKVIILDFSFGKNDILPFFEKDNAIKNEDIFYKVENEIKPNIKDMFIFYKDTNLSIFTLEKNFKNDIKKIKKFIEFLKNYFDFILINLSYKVDNFSYSILNFSYLVLFFILEEKDLEKIIDTSYKKFEELAIQKEKIKIILNKYDENKGFIPLTDYKKLAKYITDIDFSQFKGFNNIIKEDIDLKFIHRMGE